MSYVITPPDLPTSCDSCEARFTLQHAFSCKKGSLVIFQHDEIQDELVYLAGQALTPSAICNKPLIRPCRAAGRNNNCPATQNSNKAAREDKRGDIILRGFWACGMDCIMDIRRG
jgi:hypothetical protein